LVQTGSPELLGPGQGLVVGMANGPAGPLYVFSGVSFECLSEKYL